LTMAIKYEIIMTVTVDDGANFLEVSGQNRQVIKEKIEDLIYDLDDVTIEDIDVTRREE
jgi:hypothetical protein